MEFMVFKQLSRLIWKLPASLGVQESKIISFLVFYKGHSEQIDYVGYPKSQGRNVANPGIKPLTTNFVRERGCRASMRPNAYFHSQHA